MILGIDFLEQTKAKIICAEQKVIFFDDLLQVNMINRQKDVIVSVNETCVLEPKTETLVALYLSEPVWGRTVMLEQSGVRDKQRYLVAKTIVEPEGKYTVCKILNASDNKIVLRKHLQVARVQEIDVNSITEYREEEKTEASKNLERDKQKRSLKDLGIQIDNQNLTEEQRKHLITFLECNTEIGRAHV